jgi:hypothetical protein
VHFVNERATNPRPLTFGTYTVRNVNQTAAHCARLTKCTGNPDPPSMRS